MSKITFCSIDGCTRTMLAKGLCSMHYQRQRKRGTTDDPIRGRSTCGIKGCDEYVRGRGLCAKHYARLRKHGSPLAGGTTPGDPERFIVQCLSACCDECIPFPFARNVYGYGTLFYRGHQVMAHRLVLALVTGEPYDIAFEAAHRCGQGHKGCVNPSHLYWATSSQNASDKVAHGTLQRAEVAPQSRLTCIQARAIRVRYAEGVMQKDLAIEYGVTRANISAIVTGRSWKEAGQWAI